MSRSVAAIALGYQMFDPEVRLDLVVANNVGGLTYVQWMRNLIKQLKSRKLTNLKVFSFVSGLPKNKLAVVVD